MNYLTTRKLSVVVPCYLDEPNIEEMARRLTKVLDSVTPFWEVIYINDASPGNAEDILRDLAAKDSRFVVVNLSRNFGLMTVFRAGLDIATGDAVVLMDGDLQDPPELIPQFVEKWEKGYLVVYGVRTDRSEGLFKNTCYKLFYWIWRKTSNVDIPANAGEFALIDEKVAKIIAAIPERNLFLRGIRSWVGFPQTGVPYHRPQRHAGRSTQGFLKYIGWSLMALSSYSFVPLRIITLFAATSALVMFGILVAVLIGYAMNTQAPSGYYILSLTITAGFSLTLTSLAIICEYLIHIFTEVKRRPHYLIKSMHNKSTLDEKPSNEQTP